MDQFRWISFIYLTCMVLLVHSRHYHHFKHQNKKLDTLVGGRKTLIQPLANNIDSKSESSKVAPVSL